MLKLGVLASGRGSNLQSIIDAVEAGELSVEIEVVISDNEDAQALERAAKHQIEAQYVGPEDYNNNQDFEQAIIDDLERNDVELVILAGFMKLMSPYFIEHYQGRIMNIHPSLLPAFKGLHAQQQALDYGVKVSGCTVHFVDQGMDTGPIILQAAVPVKEDDTEESLANRILEEEHRIYPAAIKLYAEGKLEIEDGRVRIAK
ncbi:phosphoribosylglycinamide formyltransferase [Natroniella acetigena]|uniref:phosphoribosylglycinamide formyltransferase n=1 Tax=Natroniella acetigena TaxID=52004 RepID=UPI00200A8F72|nr:phosphoribosylglycinamide formyltransferase [Natroniella acetigena]MCK8826882.1 phosphoribosylglycinamide formyltransferase [Natroniella acetigena]